MVNKIVLCSDGTNNQGGLGRDTNVWRLYNLIKQDNTPGSSQHVHYDDGVGTEKSTVKKIAGLAFGWGLSRNVRELYTYLASHYTPGDHIYLFGFSRGAFTVRQLANMIDFCGLPNWKASENSPGDLEDSVKKAQKAYKDWCASNLGTMGFKNEFYAPKAKDRLCSEDNNLSEFIPAKNVFIGAWDTVNSTGCSD